MITIMIMIIITIIMIIIITITITAMIIIIKIIIIFISQEYWILFSLWPSGLRIMHESKTFLFPIFPHLCFCQQDSIKIIALLMAAATINGLSEQ